MLGTVADLLTVQDGAADAIAAALGAAATAVAVADLDAAVTILATLKSEDAGQAALMIAAGRPRGDGAAAGAGMQLGRRAGGRGRGSRRSPLRARPGQGARASWPGRSSSCWPGSWSPRTCGRAWSWCGPTRGCAW